jgi:hypothetical protein
VIPDWKLERYRLNELGASEVAEVQAALEVDAAVKARLEALAADDAAALAAHPAARVAARVNGTRAVVSPASRPGRAWLLAPAFAAALAAAVVAAPLLDRPGPGDDIRLKGLGPSLRVFRLTNAEPERLDEGARVRARDVVQVAFELAGAPHLVVVSVDGRGHATLHWPQDGNTQAPAGFKALPQSFELDDAPHFERFFLVTSDLPLAPESVRSAAEAAARDGGLALPGSVTTRSLVLEKVSP